MPTVLFGKNPVSLKGNLPRIGDQAPDFTFVKSDFSEGTLYEFGNKAKVIISIPSLDTGVCQMETTRFNLELGKRDHVVGIVISKDLPLAMTRFCSAQGIENVITASDYRYNEFGDRYNTVMTEGSWKGILSRVVFVVDGSNKIVYCELVPAIGSEPNYEAALASVDAL